MIARASCPDCQQVHAVLESTPSRAVAACTNCRRLWPPGQADDAGSPACHEHPGRRTRWICERCDLGWCAPCGRRVKSHGFNTTLSPCCREGLHPVAELRILRPFWTELPAVFRYALRGGGPFVLAFLFLGGFVPVLSWTIPVFAAAYGVHVIRCSSTDPATAPGFPEPDDLLVDFVYPLFRLLGATLVAWLPWVLYVRYGPDIPNPWVQTGFLALGLAVYPAIVLNAVARNRLFEALSPTDLIETMRAMGTDYLALVASLGLFILAWRTTGRVAAENELLGLLVGLVRFYLLITVFHVFGRSVWQTRHRIEWGF